MADDTRRLPKTRAARRIHREAFHVKGCKGCPMNDALVAVEDEAARAALAAAETPGPTGDYKAALVLISEMAVDYHHTGLIRDHHDPADKTGWNVKGIETCGDPMCREALRLVAALPSTDAEEQPDGR